MAHGGKAASIRPTNSSSIVNAHLFSAYFGTNERAAWSYTPSASKGRSRAPGPQERRGAGSGGDSARTAAKREKKATKMLIRQYPRIHDVARNPKSVPNPPKVAS